MTQPCFLDSINYTEVSGQLQQLAWLPNSVQQLFLWRFLLLSSIVSVLSLMETYLSVPERHLVGRRILVVGSLPSGRHRMGLRKRIKQKLKTNTSVICYK